MCAVWCVQGMPTKVVDARIACLDMNLQKSRMMMGMQVLVTDPKELEKVRGSGVTSLVIVFGVAFSVAVCNSFFVSLTPRASNWELSL